MPDPILAFQYYTFYGITAMMPELILAFQYYTFYGITATIDRAERNPGASAEG